MRILLLTAFFLFSPAFVLSDEDQFRDYWLSGKAELVSYELKQSRYGTEREGHAVAVWVTEDMDAKKHVKLDTPDEVPAGQRVKVLKLNLMRRFSTGLYDYSLMRSTFQPIDLEAYPYPLKSTFTSQDWCGQVMWQLNGHKKFFELQQFSYFESEGDRQKKMPRGFSEDQVWTQLRIDPESLPTGDFRAYPSIAYVTLEHATYRPEDVFASLDIDSRTNSLVYKMHFNHLKRTVEWHAAASFPYRILRWNEEYLNFKGEKAINSAQQREVLHSDYWNMSGTKFDDLRETFMVPSFEIN